MRVTRDTQATTKSDPDWVGEPGADNDEESQFGFNDPLNWEPGDEEDE